MIVFTFILLTELVKEKFEFEVEFDIIILLYENKILGSDERRLDSYLPLRKGLQLSLI
jgi:hypothetical protein